MKKSLSYLLPLGALLILAFLAYRWLSNRPAANTGEISPSAEGIEIADMTGDETQPTGVQDMSTIKLEAATESATPVSGEVRYSQEAKDGKIIYTVSANLSEPVAPAFYQLWFEGDKGRVKAQKLEPGKGGYIAQGTLSSEFTQVNVLISEETKDDTTLEELLLKATVKLDEKSAE